VAAIRLVYIGGGSARAPGTVATLVARSGALRGSEVVLVDLDPDRLDAVRRMTERMASARGLDLRVQLLS
jgi:6-phospho-beta-glucosidase